MSTPAPAQNPPPPGEEPLKKAGGLAASPLLLLKKSRYSSPRVVMMSKLLILLSRYDSCACGLESCDPRPIAERWRRPLDAGPTEIAEAGDTSPLETPRAFETGPTGATRPGAPGPSTTPTAGYPGPSRTAEAGGARPTGLTGALDGGPIGAQISALLIGPAVKALMGRGGALTGLRLGARTTGRWRAGALRLKRDSLLPFWEMSGR